MNYLKTKGIVLRARTGKEADIEITLYTEALGRLPARLTSARKGTARLAPLAELFSEAEYHLYMRPGASGAKVIGGLPLRSFLGSSFELEHFQLMARICELVDVLTPYHQPNPSKYEILAQALHFSRQCPHLVMSVAFALKFLRLAGFSMEPGENPDPWDILEFSSWETLSQSSIAISDQSLMQYDRQISLHIQQLINRPLKSRIFQQKLLNPVLGKSLQKK